MGVPSLNDLAVDGTLNTANQLITYNQMGLRIFVEKEMIIIGKVMVEILYI